MNNRPKLSDLLKQNLRDAWHNTDAASDLDPLPRGEYVATVERGELFEARTTGTPGYKLTFIVCEGDHAGRKVWHDVWLTEAAIKLAKRDLGKLGVTDLAQLEQPLPEGIKVRLRVALRRGDDGREFNDVTRFDVISVEPPEEPFAPATPDDKGDAWEADAAPPVNRMGAASANGPYSREGGRR